MKEPTVVGVRALAKLDGTIPPPCVERAIDALRGKTATAFYKTEPLDKVMTRKQAADLLEVCEKTVDNYVRRGYIEKIMITPKRALGLSRDSVEKLFARRKGMVV